MLHQIDLILSAIERDLVVVGETKDLRKGVIRVEAPTEIGSASGTFLQAHQQCIVPAFCDRLDLRDVFAGRVG